MKSRPPRKYAGKNPNEKEVYQFDEVKTYLSKSSAATRLRGFLVDIGAPCSVVGRKELNRILTEMGKHHRDIRPSSRSFRFGDVSCKSRGTILLMMETPTGIPPVEVNCDIVDVDVPALLGMDVLDREKLIADTVSNRLVQRIPMTSPDGKIFFIEHRSYTTF